MLKENLINARKGKNLTQDYVAEYLNIKRQTYSAYERGVSVPDAHTLNKLASLFEVTTDYLLGNTNKPDRVLPELLKAQGVEWASVIKSARSNGLTPDDINKIIDIISKRK